MSYERTPEHRAKMSAALRGKRHSWRSASTRPEVAAKIRAWWTPERCEQRRQELLHRNPDALYHGLSCKRAKKYRLAVGHCQECGAEGRLDIHHRDRDKKNQAPENLLVLCHRCHMRDHAAAHETGWHAYHRRRRTNRD